MSNEKTINVDPSLFTLSKSSSRRNKTEKIPKLKFRTHNANNRINQTLKSQALKYMRNFQQKKYDERTHHIDSNTNSTTSNNTIPKNVIDFNNDFNASVEYLNSVSQKSKIQPTTNSMPRPNHTLRAPPPMTPAPQVFPEYKPAPIVIQPASPVMPVTGSPPPPMAAVLPPVIATQPIVSMELDESQIQVTEPDDIFSGSTPLSDFISPSPGPVLTSSTQEPMYGCLKNGKLPTYRTLNRTLRAQLPGNVSNAPALESDKPSFRDWMKTHVESQKLKDKRISEVRNAVENKKDFRKIKRRKTIRRTHYVGMGGNKDKVGVLIPGKTLRNNTAIKCNSLKQAPIEDVKRKLMGDGLIKISTAAPTDVLRKMYETVSTLCGEIKNHNSDNLVYNYFNAPHGDKI